MTIDVNDMNPSTTTRHSPQSGLELVKQRRWFLLSAGGILLFGGITRLLEVFGNAQQLEISDPIVLIPFRQLLVYVGIMELVVAYLCLFTNKKTLSLSLVALLVIIYAIYRAGLWKMGWYHPYLILANLIETLNISPFMADGVATASSIFLLIGSVRVLWIENRETYAAAIPQKRELK
jgi:hypothetical protein